MCSQDLSGCKPVSPGKKEICSGHGYCHVNSSAPLGVCVCHGRYAGVGCHVAPTCGVSCDTDKGTCHHIDPGDPSADHCACFNAYEGADCTVDACAKTGGTLVDSDTCDCPAGSVQYPDPNPNVTSSAAHQGAIDAFRGCRKRCPSSPIPEFLGIECGTFAPVGVSNAATFTVGESRCSSTVVGSVVPFSPPGGTVTCSCSDAINVWNPIAKEAMPALALGDLCMPYCIYGKYLGVGTCDCIHGYEGTRCDAAICDPPTIFNATTSQCQCPDSWRYQDPTNCSKLSNVCGPAPYGTTPSTDGNVTRTGCDCSYPYTTDRNASSPTYRYCVSACGPHGTPDDSSGTCACDAAYTGRACSTPLCEHGSIPNATRGGCDCTRTPQWTGVYCNISACVGGDIKEATVVHSETGTTVYSFTCDCYPLWFGKLCQHHRCLNGATPSSRSSTAECECKHGYKGPLCATNNCVTRGFDLQPSPAPESSMGYTCPCSPAGTYSKSSGMCEDVTCNSGRLLVKDGNLTCDCLHMYTGVHCETPICTDLDTQHPIDTDDYTKGCACNDATLKLVNGVCINDHVCADYLALNPVPPVPIPMYNPVVKHNLTFHPSTIAIPVHNNFYTPGSDEPVCVCNDSRYIMWHDGSRQLNMGCVLSCDEEHGHINANVTDWFADECPCNKNITLPVGGGGTFCNGSVHPPAQTPGTDPYVEPVITKKKRSSLSWQMWALLGAVVVVLAVGSVLVYKFVS